MNLLYEGRLEDQLEMLVVNLGQTKMKEHPKCSKACQNLLLKTTIADLKLWAAIAARAAKYTELHASCTRCFDRILVCKIGMRMVYIQILD